MKFLLVVFVGFALLGSLSSASAQSETPTPVPSPTPTPSYQQAVLMSTGSELLIKKEVTYGEIAVVVSVLVLATIQLVQAFVTIPRLWMQK